MGITKMECILTIVATKVPKESSNSTNGCLGGEQRTGELKHYHTLKKFSNIEVLRFNGDDFQG